MIWDYFAIFAAAAALLWGAGALLAWRGRRSAAIAATSAGLAVFLAYVVMMWVSLHRPPLRTMGETRLWYSLFLSLAGLIVYLRRRYKWILAFSALMSIVFACINVFKPEIHSESLMPALQSPWFAPHVIVYMFAYALLGAAFIMAVVMLVRRREPQESEMADADELVRAGWAFLCIGMIFGALWAKEAWGTYWSWDPKETWAAATWLFYLVYIHYRLSPRHSTKVALWLLIAGFLLLQMCWWGVNYLPSAQGMSIHTYNMQ